MTYVDLRPDNVRPAKVRLDDGSWVDGMLLAGAAESTQMPMNGRVLLRLGR